MAGTEIAKDSPQPTDHSNMTMTKTEIESLANEIVNMCGRGRHFEAGERILALPAPVAHQVIARIRRWGYAHIANPLDKVLEIRAVSP